MEQSLYDELRPQVQELDDRFGFHFVGENYSPSDFGNSVLELEREPLRVRMVRDRGEKYIEVASSRKPNHWHTLELVLETLGKRTPNLLNTGWSEQLQLLASNLDGIESVVVGPLKPNLEIREKIRAKQRLAEITAKNQH